MQAELLVALVNNNGDYVPCTNHAKNCGLEYWCETCREAVCHKGKDRHGKDNPTHSVLPIEDAASKGRDAVTSQLAELKSSIANVSSILSKVDAQLEGLEAQTAAEEQRLDAEAKRMVESIEKRNAKLKEELRSYQGQVEQSLSKVQGELKQLIQDMQCSFDKAAELVSESKEKAQDGVVSFKMTDLHKTMEDGSSAVNVGRARAKQYEELPARQLEGCVKCDPMERMASFIVSNIESWGSAGFRRAFPPIPSSYQPKAETVTAAAEGGDLDELQYLIETKRCGVTPTDTRPPLLSASLGGRLDCVQYLIARGAVADASYYVDGDLYTALHWALLEGHRQVADYLLLFHNTLPPAQDGTARRLCDIPTGQGQTAVYMASCRAQSSLIRVLTRQFGINPHTRDKGGATALHWLATSAGPEAIYVECAEVLLDELGIDINAKDDGETTALDVAVGRKKENIVACLRSRGAQ